MANKPIRIPITFTSDPKAIKKTQKQLKNFGKAAGKMAAGVGLAVAGLAAISVKAFAKFDAAMVKSTAIMGNVSDAMRNDMSDAAREVAKTTTFSAAQAAESFFFLASAGLDAKASIQALPKVSNFAQAGMFDMALATDLLTDAQSALGLSVDDTAQNMENMSRVSDVLVRANVLANASVQQFSESLTNKAGAALKILNKDVEEGVAVLAAFADQGIKGQIAGTQLGIVLRDLSTKSIKFGDKFADAGVAVFDASGDMRNMADIVGDLEGALDGMSDKMQKATLLQLGFADKSISSLQALLGTSDAIRGYEKALRSAGGTTDEVAKNQLQGFSAQLSLMKSKFVDIGIEIGSKLAPALKGFVGAMNPILAALAPALVTMFEALLPVFEQVLGRMPTLIESIIPIIPAFGEITTVILTFVEIFLPVLMAALAAVIPFVTGVTGAFAENGDIVIAVGVALISFMGIMKVMSAVMAVATGIQTGFAIAVGVTVGWIALVIVAVAALVAGLVYFFGFTETGKKAWGSFIFYLKQQWFEFGRAHALIINGIIDGFEWMLNKAVEGLNWLSKQSNKILPDDMKIGMIAEVSFGSVIVPDILKKPIEYDFPMKNVTGGKGSFTSGPAGEWALNRRGAPSSGTGISPMLPGFASSIPGLLGNFKTSYSGGPVQGNRGGPVSYNNTVTVNQGILSGVGTSDAEAGRTIQKYLDAYSRTGGR